MSNKKNQKQYKIEVADNPAYCGIGAGGVQFANGSAIIGEGTLVNWFREHKGYTVTEVQINADNG